MIISQADQQDATEVVAGVLEPGEQLLWAGRPESQVMIEDQPKHGWLMPVLLLVGMWVAIRHFAADMPESLPVDWMFQPQVLVPAAGILIGFPAFSYFIRWRFGRYVRSLSYAMTDRRLLILEGERISDDYPPERLMPVVVQPRREGFGDVVFGMRGKFRDKKSKDLVRRERRVVAFKALADAEAMKTAIEEWLANYKRQAEASVADFMRAVNDSNGPDAALQHISHASLGLHLDFPRNWRVRVRTKKQPRGRMFLDSRHWYMPGESDDWNLVLAEGPLRCSVEVEIFETEPTLSFEELSGSRYAIEPVISSESKLEIHGLPGFSVTRRNERRLDAQGSTPFAAVVANERHTVLHDGRRQVYITSTWPEDSELLEQAVDAVVHSIRID